MCRPEEFKKGNYSLSAVSYEFKNSVYTTNLGCNTAGNLHAVLRCMNVSDQYQKQRLCYYSCNSWTSCHILSPMRGNNSPGDPSTGEKSYFTMRRSLILTAQMHCNATCSSSRPTQRCILRKCQGKGSKIVNQWAVCFQNHCVLCSWTNMGSLPSTAMSIISYALPSVIDEFGEKWKYWQDNCSIKCFSETVNWTCCSVL